MLKAVLALKMMNLWEIRTLRVIIFLGNEAEKKAPDEARCFEFPLLHIWNMIYTWVVSYFLAESACTHTCTHIVWGGRCINPLSSVYKNWTKTPPLCRGFIMTAPVDRWVIFCWEHWVNLLVCRFQHILVGLCSPVILCCTSVQTWAGKLRRRSSTCLHSVLLIQSVYVITAPSLHSPRLGAGPRSGTYPPASAFHRCAGGSGEKFEPTAPPILVHLLRSYLPASVGVHHQHSRVPVTSETLSLLLLLLQLFAALHFYFFSATAHI